MNLKISRILHAGYVFECNDTLIAFDPIFENPFSQNCHAFPDIRFDHIEIRKLKLDAVFISHYHDDHCSFESLYYLDRKTPLYVYCLFEELFLLIRKLGFENVYTLQLNESVSVGPFEIIPRRALDADVDSIFHIKADGLNVLNVVDSWIDSVTMDVLANSAPWDLVLWPFQTMREIEVLSPSRFAPASTELPPEWIEQLRILNPKYVVPSSCQFVMENWSWYNQAFFPISYKQFEKEIRIMLPQTQVVRLNPGTCVVLHKNSIERSSPLNWIHPVGEQNVDYEYMKNLKPPGTAEISQRFAELPSEKKERVLDYCRNGLLEKYRFMEACTDIYFNKTRLWQLSVYDHLGNAINFYYRLHGQSIDLETENTEPIEWLTEIPIFKLYSALENGEALTSLYIRINDRVFMPEIENEIASVDILEDPLVRCLYYGVFGAYQKAQLKRINLSQ